MSDVEDHARKSRAASAKLASTSTDQKDEALLAMADALEQKTALILEDNEKDLSAGREKGTSSVFMDRLILNESRIKEMADGLREVAVLRDPVGELVDGLSLIHISEPTRLGMISYAVFCLKKKK